ncbi:MAG: AMP-binding protein [Desulfonatronovibrio sp.]
MRLQTIPELLSSRNIEPDQPAVMEFKQDSVQTINREEIFRKTGQLAAGLLEAGLNHGDRVVLIAPNSANWIISALGVMFAGAVVVPLDTQMPGEDLEHVLSDCAPGFIFTTKALKKRIPDIAHTSKLYFFDAEDGSKQSWEKLLADEPAQPAAREHDIAAIFYTSGTTGPPKGVPLSHSNLTSNVQALQPDQFLDQNDRVLVPLPFHHVYPFTVGILIEFTLGTPVIVPFSLVGPQIMRALREGKATAMLGVPRLYQAIWDALESRVRGRGRLFAGLFKLLLKTSMTLHQRLRIRLGKFMFSRLHKRLAPELRLVVSGGAALDPDLGRKFQALGWEVATGYGLSETSPILTFNPPAEIKLASAGKILPGTELAIDDSKSGQDAGEVMARGPNVFKGYWNMPEKSREVLDDEGWFRTGDTGRLSRDGYLYLKGRESSTITLSGGENIDPERVEKALAESRDIREAGVLEHQDRLAAVVVPDSDLLREVAGENLQKKIKNSVNSAAADLPSHHRPGILRISLDPLARTRLGKLRRHKLKELFQALEEKDSASQVKAEPLSPESMAPEDQQLLSDPRARKTWDYLARQHPDIRLTPDSSLSLDLGIDSLNWINLTLDLRQYAGVELDDSAIARVQNVRDLLRETTEAPGIKAKDSDLAKELKHPEKLLDSKHKELLKPYGPVRRFFAYILLGLARGIISLLLRIEIRGKLPENTPCIIAPRHLSVLDPLVIVKTMDKDKLNNFYWAGWIGLLFTSPLRRWFSRTARILPVDPGAAPRASLGLATAALKRDHGLIWFPEGQRSPDGKLQKFKPGIGMVLRAHPVPVIPVWIQGTWEAMPPGRLLPRPGKALIIIGNPVNPDRLPEDEYEIAELIRSEVQALSDQ